MNSKFWAGNGPDDHQAVIPVRITPAGFFRKIAPPISDVNYARVTSSCVCVEHEDISIDDSSDLQFFFLSRKSDAVGVDAGNFSICSKVSWCVGRWVPPVGLDWLIIEMMRRRRRSKCRWAPIRKLLPFHPPVFARSPDEGDAVMLFIAAGLHLPVN